MYYKTNFYKTKHPEEEPSNMFFSMYKDKKKHELIASAQILIFPEFDLVNDRLSAFDIFDAIDGAAEYTISSVFELPKEERMKLSNRPIAYVPLVEVKKEFRGNGHAHELLENMLDAVKKTTKCENPAIFVLADTFDNESKKDLHRLLDKVSWLKKGNDGVYIY